MEGGADEHDVERAIAGDMAAFERLYRRHAARVHALARRMIGPRLAEDATQEIFVRAWRKLGGYRGTGSFRGWLSRLASRHLLTRIRRAGPGTRGETPHEQAVVEAAARETSLDRVFDLEAAVMALPEGARHVLVLHDVEGYGHAEIARLLGVSVGTSKSQLHRARSLVRIAMEQPVAAGGRGGVTDD